MHNKRNSSKIIEEEEVEDPFARRGTIYSDLKGNNDSHDDYCVLERRSVSWTPNTTPAAIIDEDDDDEQL